MIKSYFKLAVRNLLKNKTFASINLLGLAVGLASVLMILSFIRHELSYDLSYNNSKRVFRLVQQTRTGGLEKESVWIHTGMAAALEKEFPEIEAVTYPLKTKFEFINNEEGISLNALRVDSSFFKVFNLPFAQGSPSVVPRPYQVFISERVAQTYFPDRNAIGEKLISIDPNGARVEKTIVGVIKDMKATHFSADVIFSSYLDIEDLNWRTAYSAMPQYVLIREHTSIHQVERKIHSFYRKYGFPKEVTMRFQPVTSIHLHSRIEDEPFANGDIRHVYIFALVALLILLIGCINYVNLSTARSLQRVQEVGVRKVLGADRSQLAAQFIGEAFLTFCLALPVAFCLADMFWPLFTHIMSIGLTTRELFSLQNLLLITIVAIVSGVLSGSYPAIFLSRLQPTAILKNNHKGFQINLGLRKGLIVLQFVISVSLIIATTVVYRQLQFINNMPLVFNKNHLIVLAHKSYGSKWEAFSNELKKYHRIDNVTIASWNVGERYGGSSSMNHPKDSTRELKFAFVDTDVNFLNTLQIKLLEGRALSNEDASFSGKTDSLLYSKKHSPEEFSRLLASRPILVSDNTARALDLDKPVGEVLRLGALQGTIVGLIQDFQGLSLHQKNTPLVIRAHSTTNIGTGSVYIRIAPEQVGETINYIQAKWKHLFPQSRFDFSFVDERLQKLYDVERKLAWMFAVFAVLAISIACFGLFSLVALIIQQRTKEIGIRKALGASVGEIVELISKDFFKLILISICIAGPIAGWAMNQWLQDFANRVCVGWWVFAVGGLAALFVAMVAIGFQTLRAAVANPVDSLRSE
jgi:putative ABC transport system permease protein